MSSRLTPKPRIPLVRAAVASTAVVLTLSTAACADPIAPMPPPDAAYSDVAPPMVDVGPGGPFDAYTPPPMPPPEDAGEPPRDGPMSPVDAALVPMIDGSLPSVDSGEIPPMPPPMIDPDPDSGVIAPMPPPPPPMPMPKP